MRREAQNHGIEEISRVAEWNEDLAARLFYWIRGAKKIKWKPKTQVKNLA